MTEVLRKTVAVTSKLISDKLSGNNATGTGTFHHFIKTLNRLSSEYEEDRFIKRKVLENKDRLSSPSCPLNEKRELLVTLLFCDMLGYDVSFAHIHALKLAHQGTLKEKRTGYLACTMFLREGDELVILLTGTLMKDLHSSNVLHICYALDAAASLISAELMPTVLPAIQDKLNHQKELVRRKAVMCVHSFLERAPSMVQHLHPAIQRTLCDPQPSVMAAALHVYTQLAKADPALYRASLLPALLGLLEQILSRQLSREYDHHGVPAPWLTIHALKLLAIMAKDHAETTERICPMLRDVLRRTEITHKVGLAVVYECVETIATLRAPADALEHAASCVARFLSAKSVNYKYLGLKALTSIVKVSSEYAVPHQDILIECLDHEDKDIRDKTLELLYHMANSVNVAVISGRILERLTISTETAHRVNLANKLLILTQKFSDRHENYLETMNKVLGLVGEEKLDGWTDTIIRTIQQGTESLPACEDSHLLAVRTYWTLLQQEKLPASLLNIAVWVLGEYSHLTTLPDLPEICRCLLDRYHRVDTPSKLAILDTFTKILLTAGEDSTDEVLSRLTESTGQEQEDSVQVRQRLQELQGLSQASTEQKESLRSLLHDSTNKPDFSLSFMDQYVTESLESGGGEPYRKTGDKEEASSLFAGIGRSSMVDGSRNIISGSLAASVNSGSRPTSSHGSTSSQTAAPNPKDLMSASLQLDGVKRVWGREGMQKRSSPSPATPIAENTHNISYGDSSNVQADEKVQKSQLAASLFGGISSPRYSTNTANPAYNNPPAALPSHQLVTGDASADINAAIQNLTLQHNDEVLRTHGQSQDKPWPPHCARNLEQQYQHLVAPHIEAHDDLPPMEFSVNPDSNPQFKGNSKQALKSVRPNELNDNIELMQKTQSVEGFNNTNQNTNVKALSMYHNNHNLASPQLSDGRQMDTAAAQSLLTASALTSPVEYEERSMYSGLNANDLSPEHGYVNVQAGGSAVGAVAKLELAQCDSVGSMDTDSIEGEPCGRLDVP